MSQVSEHKDQVTSVKTNMMWSASGSLFYSFGRFFAFMLFAKYLNQVQLGQFALSLAIVTPLSFLINMELKVIYVTDQEGKINFSSFISLRWITNSIFFVVLVCLCLVLRDQWSLGMLITLLLVGLIRIVESLGEVYIAVLQRAEKMNRIGQSQAIKSLLVLFWSWIILNFIGNMYLVLVGWVILTLVMIYFYDRRWAKNVISSSFRFDKSSLARLARLAFPLGIFVTITSFSTGIARIFIEHKLTIELVGYYAALTMFISGLASIQNGVNQSVLARMAVYFSTNISALKRLIYKMLTLTWAGVFAILLFVYYKGEWVLNLIYNEAFAEYAYLFWIVILAGLFHFSGMLLGDAIVASGRYKSRLVAVLIGLIIKFIGFSLVVDTYGLKGVVWVEVVASVSVMLICAGVLIQAIKSRLGTNVNLVAKT